MIDVRRGPKEKYKWEKWFQRPKFLLRQGRDFSCQVHGMVAMLRRQAALRSLTVRIKVDGQRITVEKVGVT